MRRIFNGIASLVFLGVGLYISNKVNSNLGLVFGCISIFIAGWFAGAFLHNGL